MTKTLKRAPNRGPLIEQLTVNTHEGTDAIVTAVLAESVHNPGWRPVRAATVMAIAMKAAPDDHCWMTTLEFAHFISSMGLGAKRRGAANTLADDLGMSALRRLKLLRGEPIKKVEALACAHFALGLEMPVPAGDHVAFSAMVDSRFAGIGPLAAALGVSVAHLSDRIRGFGLRSGQQYAVEPEGGIIRACDWIWRIGPFSPYGVRLPAEAWPGQGDL